jgi:phosphatidylglycerol:prolipoprotein diacylglycerol transferase
MSFHGGFIGVLIGVWIFGRWKKYSFFEITDILAVIMPIAL